MPRKGGFFYKDYQKWCDNLNKSRRGFNSWLIGFMYDQLELLIADIKQRTPVDTGALRNSWRVEKVEKRGNEIVGWFINDEEYASHVEWGHAWPYYGGIASEGDLEWVYGRFMMRISLQKFYENLPKIYEKASAEYFERNGIGDVK